MAVSVGKSSIVSNNLVLYLDSSSPINYTLNEVEVLVVAGGGGGGGRHAGGGGGGGVLYISSYSVTPGSAITVTVGNGGAAAPYGGRGGNGQNSLFGTITTIGGGGGGGYADGAATVIGASGGSGGGGAGAGGLPGGNGSGGAGTPGQGNRGGDPWVNGWPGAGGGGAGTPGQSPRNGLYGGRGGDGLLYNISGVPRYYGGGGGGGGEGNVDLNGGLGGLGGGGRATGAYNPTQGQPGQSNTGGGGGGSRDASGSSGGSGVVIVRYPGPQKATGGNTITQVGGYTIHTFTSSGTFTPSSAPANSGAINGLQDLSGNNNTGTQVGGVTYNTENGGILNFDGTNDYVNCGKTAAQLGIYDADYTFDAWVYPTNLSSDKTMFGTDQTGTRQGLHLVFRSGAIYQGHFSQDFSAGSATLNAWNNISYTYVKSSGLASIYKNGVLQGSGTILSFIGTGNILIGRWTSNYYFSGNGSNYKIYNRALSAAEILQNFNALRGRFGV